MTKVISYSHTFGGLSSPVPLSYLDDDLANVNTAMASLNTFANYLVDTGAVNAYAVTTDAGTVATLAAGLPIQVKIANGNTSASTLAINGGVATPIKTTAGAALSSGMMPAGGIAIFQFDGTNFQLLNPTPLGVFTKSFTSADQVITGAGALTLAHSLGSIPTLIQAFLVCQTGEHGYTAGDITPVTTGTFYVAQNYGMTIVPDAINLNIRYAIGAGAGVFLANDLSAGAVIVLTNANWKVRFHAWV
jgi:hypothetical protein